jgi:hypothetical protein
MKALCEQLQDQMIDHVLGLLDQQQQKALLHHVKTCAACEVVLRKTEEKQNLLSALGQQCEAQMPERIERCIDALNQVESGARAKPICQWRKIMTMPIVKLAGAAVVAVTVSLTALLQPGLKTPALPGLLPMSSLKADGSFRFDQLVLPVAEKPYTVVDQAWYDPPSGRFVRLLETESRVVFANSYDGEFVYTTQAEPGAKQTIARKPIAPGFQPPAKPADFFGLAAGLRSSLSKNSQGGQSDYG